jgi:uncharacterized protein (DUF2141 family)
MCKPSRWLGREMITDEHAMTRIRQIGCGLVLGRALMAPLARAAALRVEMHGVANTKGQAMIALFDKVAGFPHMMVQGLALDAVPPMVTGVFTDLQTGEFAVAVYHDENGNGKLDRHLFGVLTEPYGFSREATGRMGPPSFADAKFGADGVDQAIIINLHC